MALMNFQYKYFMGSHNSDVEIFVKCSPDVECNFVFDLIDRGFKLGQLAPWFWVQQLDHPSNNIIVVQIDDLQEYNKFIEEFPFKVC